MSETDYLVDCEGDSSEYFSTLAAAEEFAAEYEADLRANAQRDGEWPEDTAIRIYALLSESVVEDQGDGLHDYTRRVTDLTPGCVADLRRQRDELARLARAACKAWDDFMAVEGLDVPEFDAIQPAIDRLRAALAAK